MKELNIKIFLTLFIIFTIFITSTTFANIYQNYNKEYNSIKENINTSYKLNDTKKVFINQNIYTIFFDTDKNITGIISHGVDSEDDIESIAEKIIKNSNYGTKINLFSKYSYSYNNSSLIIYDNTNSRLRLFSILNILLVLYVIFEVLAFIISHYITKYLTKPVIEAFEKQKNFIADASHELKTPIAVIMASSDALSSTIEDNKYLDNIKNETERMNNLVTELLTLSKTEQENKIYNNLNISKVINKRILTFDPLAFENNVSFNTKITDEIYLKCNEEDINKLVGILLDNAIKHSYKKKKIDVNLYKNNNEIIFSVTNEGKEIPKENIDKIFERFYKIDESRNRSTNNYGLGLSIAKGIVTNYNGKILVNSSDKKTTFIVKLKNNK